MSGRQAQLRIAFDPNFGKQADVDTPRDLAGLTAVFQARAPQHVDLVQKVEDLFDCSGNFLINKRVVSRLGKITVEIDCSTRQLAGIIYWAMGVSAAPAGAGPYTQAVSQLPINSHQPPFMTLVVGFDDGEDVGVVFSSVCVNSLTLSAEANGRWKVKLELCGKGDLPAATGFVWPGCSNQIPPLMYEGAFTMGGTNRMLTTANAPENQTSFSFELTYSNNLGISDDAWQGGGVDITRLERAELRTMELKWEGGGRVGDALYAMGKAFTATTYVLTIGSGNEKVVITCNPCLIELDSPAQGFRGEFNRRTLKTKLTATKTGGSLPLSAVVTSATALTQFGLPPA